MSTKDLAHAAQVMLEAARAASELVLRIYREPDLGVTWKGPADPVTRADKEANALLLDRLGRALPGVPIVAEESDPEDFAGFGEAREALFVDPIDGTREFIERNGEFAVMVALAEEGAARASVIVCPAFDLAYVGIVGVGAHRIGADGVVTPIHVSPITDLASARCAVSRSHRSPTLDGALSALGCKGLVPIGSAGLKGVRVAEAAVDVFAHPSGHAVKLWDAAAPDALVRAAGGVLTDAKGTPFDYRGPYTQGSGVLAANAELHAAALAALGEDLGPITVRP